MAFIAARALPAVIGPLERAPFCRLASARVRLGGELLFW
jgi:hypothetical protein